MPDDANVTTLAFVRPNPAEAVVKELEALLESARSGEILTICGCARLRGGSWMVLGVGQDDPLMLVGMLEWAKFGLMSGEPCQDIPQEPPAG